MSNDRLLGKSTPMPARSHKRRVRSLSQAIGYVLGGVAALGAHFVLNLLVYAEPPSVDQPAFPLRFFLPSGVTCALFLAWAIFLLRRTLKRNGSRVLHAKKVIGSALGSALVIALFALLISDFSGGSYGGVLFLWMFVPTIILAWLFALILWAPFALIARKQRMTRRTNSAPDPEPGSAEGKQ